MDVSEFCSPPKRTILGNLTQNGSGSPISPMANLKLLTKVATSHLSENSVSDEVTSRNVSQDNTKPSRRFRSLSYICKNFLQIYKLDIPPGQSLQISLGKLALSLGIEKRRVYDIINVVSSLHMAVKVCKDKYKWVGNQNLPRLLAQLKTYALINKLDEQINNVLQNQILCSSTSQEISHISITNGGRPVFEENRIGVLCQKFIMLFLVCNNDIPLNMCTISKLILSGDVQDKTGMRRLYDIANVLEALDLIERYHCKIMKKPSFKYCGPEITLNQTDFEQLCPVTLPCLNVVVEGSDYNDKSDSSMDSVNNLSKLDSILEVVSSEFEEENSSNSRKLRTPIGSPARKVFQRTAAVPPTSEPPIHQCNARKQLFPTTTTTTASYISPALPLEAAAIELSDTFIKAPKESFRLSFNKLKVKEINNRTETANNNNNNNNNNNEATLVSLKTLPNINNNNINFSSNFDEFSRLKDHKVYNFNFDHVYNNINNNTDTSKVDRSNDSGDCKNKTLFLSKITDLNSAILHKKIKVLRPTKISDIKNGGVYKVLKKGNTVQLYAL